MRNRNCECLDYWEDHGEDLVLNEHALYRLSPPPPSLPFNDYIRRYRQSGDEQYFLWFLHHYETRLNRKAYALALNYAMPERWPDLKQVIIQGLLEAAAIYDPNAETDFLAMAESDVKAAVHRYVRTMRTGFSVSSATTDALARKAMRLFHAGGSRTDDHSIAAIAAAIRRTPQFTRRLIQDAFLNMQMIPPLRTDENGNEEDFSQYAPDGNADPAILYPRLQRRQALHHAFEQLSLREQEIVAAHLGFCPDCWSDRDEKGKRLPRQDFHYIGLTHELQAKAAQRAYHKALQKMRKSILTDLQEDM